MKQISVAQPILYGWRGNVVAYRLGKEVQGHIELPFC